jgi:hypothetical protein
MDCREYYSTEQFFVGNTYGACDECITTIFADMPGFLAIKSFDMVLPAKYSADSSRYADLVPGFETMRDRVPSLRELVLRHYICPRKSPPGTARWLDMTRYEKRRVLLECGLSLTDELKPKRQRDDESLLDATEREKYCPDQPPPAKRLRPTVWWADQ